MREDRQLAMARFMLPRALECDRFVALNEKVVDELRSAGVAPERIVEMGNGVETDRIAPRSDYRLGDPTTITYVGRLHAQKDLPTLLRAVSRLSGEWPGARLRLIGEGPERERLAGLSGEIGVSAQVDFVGTVSDIAPWLESSDVLVLPSLAEGLSNALLEAMAAGLPVVASDIPGNAGVVVDGVNGLLFPPGDDETLAATLGRVLDNEEERRRLGQAARRTVVADYGLDRVAQRYLEMYADLAGAPMALRVGGPT
jgi:glycosyltransferase involved in cell wall biosynthesis